MSYQEVITNVFTSFPDNARIWVYQNNSFIDNEKATAIQLEIDFFTQSWTAHQKKVTASGKVLFNYFVVLIADENEVSVSGCSIDSSVKFIQHLQSEYQLNFFDRFYSVLQIDDNLMGVSKQELQELWLQNKITQHTLVFNNLVDNLYQFRHQWFQPIENSWQAKILKLHLAKTLLS